MLDPQAPILARGKQGTDSNAIHLQIPQSVRASLILNFNLHRLGNRLGVWNCFNSPTHPLTNSIGLPTT